MREFEQHISLPQHKKKIIPPLESQEYEEDNSKLSGAIQLIYSLILLGILMLVLGGIGFYLVQNTKITSLELQGNTTLSEIEVLNYLDIKLPTLYSSLDTGEIKDKLEAHPQIFQAAVKRTIKGTLEVYLEKVLPIVTVLAEIDGKTVPVYFDEKGRCVQIGFDQSVMYLPVLSGLTLVNPEIGVEVPSWLKDLMFRLSTIEEKDQKLYNRISEIHIVSQGQGYKTLELSFVKLQAKFITEVDIDVHSISQLWAIGLEFEGIETLSKFDYFDTRQGVIIGKKRENES